MKRLFLIRLAEDLMDAQESEIDALDALISAYKVAREHFTASENDPDPTTIALGVQACALGIRTLSNWLDAMSTITSYKYLNRGREVYDRAQSLLDSVGIAMPDVMTL